MNLTLLDRLRARPGLPFALLVLLACLLPLVTPAVRFAPALSLIDVVGYAASLRRYASLVPGASGDAVLAFYGFYLLYLVPLAAAWLAIREALGIAGDRLRLAVGLIGLLVPPLAFGLVALIFGRSLPPREGLQLTDTLVQLLTSPGIGWILMIAASAALIATGCGWRPLGRARDGG